jgi:hypothetical protein
MSFPEEHITSLRTVEVNHTPTHITIIGHTEINSHNQTQPIMPETHLQGLYDALPSPLKKLCGKFHLPPDGGHCLMSYLTTTNTPLLGVADASLKEGNCSHAWILTSNNSAHINDPNMIIHGAGPVDGYANFMTSVRGELQGQTAMAIMSQKLLTAHNSPHTPVHFYGDNQGIQNNLQRQAHWVSSHQDEGTPWESITDLQALKLSPEATLNVFCDKESRKARVVHQSYPDAEVRLKSGPSLPSPLTTTKSCVTLIRHLQTLYSMIPCYIMLP